jgi:hypothetical protein
MDDFKTGKNTTALPEGLTKFDFNTKVKDIMPAGSDWSLMDEWAYQYTGYSLACVRVSKIGLKC